jgi:hypothetical protein
MTQQKTPSQGLALGDRSRPGTRMQHALRWSVLALVASLLSACGGGNSSDDGEAAAPEGVVATHNLSNAKTNPRVQE